MKIPTSVLSSGCNADGHTGQCSGKERGFSSAYMFYSSRALSDGQLRSMRRQMEDSSGSGCFETGAFWAFILSPQNGNEWHAGLSSMQRTNIGRQNWAR